MSPCNCGKGGQLTYDELHGRVRVPVGMIAYVVEGGTLSQPQRFHPNDEPFAGDASKAIAAARDLARQTGARVRSVRT